jgi:hypothetical protein
MKVVLLIDCTVNGLYYHRQRFDLPCMKVVLLIVFDANYALDECKLFAHLLYYYSRFHVCTKVAADISIRIISPSQAAADVLDQFGVPYELSIVSAHRTPKRMYEYAEAAAGRGIKVQHATIHCTPYTIHCTPYTAHYAGRGIKVQHATIHCTPYTAHHTLHTIHCTPYTAHHTLHTIRWTQTLDVCINVFDQIQKAIKYTQRSNVHSHPTGTVVLPSSLISPLSDTLSSHLPPPSSHLSPPSPDCPQREKRGWTGDSQITSGEASLNFDTSAMYYNWLEVMEESDQVGCNPPGAPAPVFPRPDCFLCCDPAHGSFGCNYEGVPGGDFKSTAGAIADVVPFMHVGGWPGDPSWGVAGATIPW